MSVTFWVTGEETDPERRETFVNVANDNAADLLRWLGIPFDAGDLWGEAKASELAALCRRRLWNEPINQDPGVQGSESGGPGTGQVRVVDCGRRPGYLPERAAELLALCVRAGGGRISWG